MYSCVNKVIQYIPNPATLDYKAVEMVCGNTDIYGGTIRCSACTKKNKRPWYECKHGKDLSENEMACELCNAENE